MNERTQHEFVNGDCRCMSMIPNNSVQLIVTSPPYWQLKDYGIKGQIGFNDTYEQYINNLNIVWSECHRVLCNGCRMCINIGDQFARSAYYGRYKVIPIHSEIIRFCENIGFDYMGSIIWQKPTNTHTTGGQKVMGSYPYPRGGIVKIDFENILLFKKHGKSPDVPKHVRSQSIITDDEWHTYVGDTILDPFMGSGTTALAAKNLRRNSIGYEINSEYIKYYREKVMSHSEDLFLFREDKSVINLESAIEKLPYRFKDIHELNKKVDVKSNTYGSIIDDKNFTKNKLNDINKEITS